jgi:multidrug resistance efflux pump
MAASPERRRWYRSPALLVGVGLLTVAGVAAYLWASRRHPLELSGSIEANDVEVGSLVGGRVARVLVAEGDQVRRGQPLVLLESDLLQPEVDEQRARVEEASARLAAAERGPRPELLARNRIDWEQAERERKRQQMMLQSQATTRQQYDDAAAKAAGAHELYLERRRGERHEDIEAARAALGRERAHLGLLEERLRELTVRAPVDGRVESFDLRPGALLNAQQPAVTVLERDQVWVRVYVPEPRLGEVRLGQHAEVRIDTFPRRHFDGQVVSINHQGEYTPRNLQTREQRQDLVFGVKVQIHPDPALKAGMAASVTLAPGRGS